MSDAINDTVQLMRSGTIHNVDQWDAHMATIGASKEDEVRCLFACAVKVPEHAVLISTLFAAWRQKQYPLSHRVSTVKTVEGVEIPAHSNTNFRVDDLVCLEARIADAKAALIRYGKWWRIKGGHGSTGVNYLIQSIYSSKQKRTEPKSKVELLVIGKAGDLRYNVVNVVKFPCSVEDIPT